MSAPYGLRQTLAATLQPFTQYTLEVEVGNIASGTALDGTPFNLDGFPGYRIELLAGNTLLADDDDSLTIAEGQFATATVSLTTGATHDDLNQPLTIRLLNLNQVDPATPGADREVDFDDVRLDATIIPEPSTTAALTGAAALLAPRRRRACPLSPRERVASLRAG